MENQIYLITLFDYYGELLTDKQKQYFKDYYFDNLSLGEMRENYQVSRNAIHKAIKETCEKLNFYEEKLKLYDKKKKLEKLISSLDEDLKAKITNYI